MLKILISISLLFSSIIFSQEPTPFCGTPDPTEDEIELVNDFLDSFQNSDQPQITNTTELNTALQIWGSLREGCCVFLVFLCSGEPK